MRIALDAQLCVGTATGIGEYVRGLAEALKEAGVDIVELSEPGLDPWRFDRRVLWDQVFLPSRARKAGADLLHCASGTVPFFANVPIVVTVHDLAWTRVQAHTPPYARYYFGRFSIERYRRAARIAVDSRFSRNELLWVLDGYDPSAIHVVYPGVAEDFCTLERRGGDGRTILVVGTVERRKNLGAVIAALPSLPGARVLAVGPSTPYQDECYHLAASLGVADRIEFLGYVPRVRLLQLYSTCGVVAMPSRYEGFGYAAAQALCSGVPCVVSDRSSLPEVAGNDGRVVAIDDQPALIDALARTLAGEDDARAAAVRERAIARFSWLTSARSMEQVYRAALGT
ncbi:MAG: glycosyltransferase family 4 protein [Candidatus Eremiobacteraeota bacterium]|nr:glycosyltransferase family 4 protein [Candidatus Eremiobacteraeota bacterium]